MTDEGTSDWLRLWAFLLWLLSFPMLLYEYPKLVDSKLCCEVETYRFRQQTANARNREIQIWLGFLILIVL